MLRISTRTDDNGLSVELEGSLVGPWVVELRRVTQQLLPGAKALHLELHKLRFVDSAGADLLRELAKRASHTNCSPFIRQQLEGGKHDWTNDSERTSR